MRPEREALDEGPDPLTHLRPFLVLGLVSGPMAVRAALAELRQGLTGLVAADAAGSIELVLAEVLNNICEHGYRDIPGGAIQVSVWIEGEMLVFETRDYGLPMPGGRVPAGRRAQLDCPVENLPEGGFGWYLIRQLTADLTYARQGERNHLTFRMRRDAQPIQG